MTLTVSALALTCFALLGAGYAVLFILGRVPALAPAIREALRGLNSASIVVVVIAGVFWIGGWLLSFALLAHAARIGFEAASVANKRREIVQPLAAAFGIAALCLIAAFLPIKVLCIAALGAMAALLALHRMQNTAPDSATAAVLDLVIFPTVPLVVFTAAGLQGHLSVWLLAGYILAETFDSYAFLGGKMFGRTKAFPKLSPRKTIEGLCIGAAMLMVTVAIVGAVLGDQPVLASAAFALLAGALTLAGDLAASRLKRRSGVKDYPAVLPQQGGLLDTTDSWITTGAGLVAVAVLLGAA